MISNKHYWRNRRNETVHPAANFVNHLSRLITDVDRLVLDISDATKNVNGCSSGNRWGETRWSGAMSAVRRQARSFAESLRQFGVLPDTIPVPYLELDGQARIVRINRAGAQVLNGLGTPITGKSLFSFVAEADIKSLREQLDNLRRTSKPAVVYVSILDKGKSHPVQLKIRRNRDCKASTFVAVVDRTDPQLN